MLHFQHEKRDGPGKSFDLSGPPTSGDVGGTPPRPPLNPTPAFTRSYCRPNAPNDADIPSRGPEVSEQEEDNSSQRKMERQGKMVTQDQLLQEVVDFYRNLSQAEEQSRHHNSKLAGSDDKQWQNLTNTQIVLLGKYHDIIFASQHPCATPLTRHFVSRFNILPRMQDSMKSYLNTQQQYFLRSKDHLDSFLYQAFPTVAVLWNTVPTFANEFAMMIVVLARHRIGVADDMEEKTIWSLILRDWCSYLSDKWPTNGDLYWQLMMAADDPLERFFYLSKTWCVSGAASAFSVHAAPDASSIGSFESETDSTDFVLIDSDDASSVDSVDVISVDSVDTASTDCVLIDSVGAGSTGPVDATSVDSVNAAFADVGHTFVQSHTAMLEGRLDILPAREGSFYSLLRSYINTTGKDWKRWAYIMGIVNCCAFSRSVAHRDTRYHRSVALGLMNRTHKVILEQLHDANALPYVYVVLVFLLYAVRCPHPMKDVTKTFPWTRVSVLLNSLLKQPGGAEIAPPERNTSNNNCPPPEAHLSPLPEDFDLRGLEFVDEYPIEWSNLTLIYEERYHEEPSMAKIRGQRILWLGFCIAKGGSPLVYNEDTKQYHVK